MRERSPCYRLDGICPVVTLFLKGLDNQDFCGVFLDGLMASRSDTHSRPGAVRSLKSGLLDQLREVEDITDRLRKIQARRSLCPKCPWHRRFRV